jgi:hypothetical protein
MALADRRRQRDGAAHAPNGDSLSYGELAALASLHVEARPDVPRRARGVSVIGTSLPRVDIPAKVTGGAAYLQDMRLSGMLHARVVRGPSEGTRLKPADIDAVAKMPGIVRVVRDGGFTAVLAGQEWQAVKALRRLQSAGWDRAGAPLPAEDMREAIRRLPARDVPIFDYPGPPASAGGRVVKARYSRPCLMHGAIGPSCALALWEKGGVTVWTHSQGVYPLQRRWPSCCACRPTRCAASMSKARVATATTAPTMSPPTQPLPPARCRAGRCACNGCASRSMAGSRSARRWSSSWKPRWATTAASPAGAMTCGATRIAPGRPPPAACSPVPSSIRPSRRR